MRCLTARCLPISGPGNRVITFLAVVSCAALSAKLLRKPSGYSIFKREILIRKLTIIYSLMFLLTACSSSQSSFAYDSIIKYYNQIYVGTKEKTDKISKKIGQIEVYSDKEVDDSKGIFSNKYKVMR
jgi:hypothetical protein